MTRIRRASGPLFFVLAAAFYAPLSGCRDDAKSQAASADAGTRPTARRAARGKPDPAAARQYLDAVTALAALFEQGYECDELATELKAVREKHAAILDGDRRGAMVAIEQDAALKGEMKTASSKILLGSMKCEGHPAVVSTKELLGAKQAR